MRARLITLALSIFALAACATPRATSSPTQPARHIIYLHGRIVQEKGPQAISDEFGPYQLSEIVRSLGSGGAVVHAPLRPKSQRIEDAATATVSQIQDLLKDRVPAHDITVVGASQGGIIAMLTSAKLADPELKFVLLGACNPYVRDRFAPDLNGKVLSVYEQGDPYGGSCRDIVGASSGVVQFKELRLTTGLGHGFLYAPLAQWVDAALDWSESGGN